jgi:hypothetical protein
MEGEPERTIEAGREGRGLAGLVGAVGGAQHANAPGRVSAMKTSPLGATRMARGPLSPDANSAMLNPGGTRGTAPAGRATTRGPLPADGVAPGGGRSAGVMCRQVPGASARQSPKAALPVRMRPSGVPCACAPVAVTMASRAATTRARLGMANLHGR